MYSLFMLLFHKLDTKPLRRNHHVSARLPQSSAEEGRERGITSGDSAAVKEGREGGVELT